VRGDNLPHALAVISGRNRRAVGDAALTDAPKAPIFPSNPISRAGARLIE
jgi:hypothetical protein